jgi:D-alanyl-D-alanine carboxypeptidase
MIKIGVLAALTFTLLSINFPKQLTPEEKHFTYSQVIIKEPKLVVNAPLWGMYVPLSGQIISSSSDTTGMASLTKLFTALAALSDSSRPNQLTVPDQLPSSAPLIGFVPKSKIAFTDVLQASLIPSGNDAATVLGTIDFSLARELPKRLGLTKTEIIEPTGLDPHNISSVQDMLLMGAIIIRNPLLRGIVSQKTFTYEDRVYPSTNRLLGEGFSGIKTGYLPETGAHLLGLTRSNPEVITLVMGTASQDDRFDQSSSFIRQLRAQEIILD